MVIQVETAANSMAKLGAHWRIRDGAARLGTSQFLYGTESTISGTIDSWNQALAGDLTIAEVDFLPWPKKPRFDSVEDLLHTAGVTQAAMNSDVWDFADTVAKNPAAGYNDSFVVQCTDGKTRLLKVYTRKERAVKEAEATSILSKNLPFVPCGYSVTPFEASGLYIALQDLVTSESHKKPNSTIDDQIARLAIIHRDAAPLLQAAGVKVNNERHWTKDMMQDYFEKSKYHSDITIDFAKLMDAVDYLSNEDHFTFIHGDYKKDNHNPLYVFDWESSGWGHPAKDLALHLMQKQIPSSIWGQFNQRYLLKRDADVSDESLKELSLASEYGAIYSAVKELFFQTRNQGLENLKPHTLALLPYLN